MTPEEQAQILEFSRTLGKSSPINTFTKHVVRDSSIDALVIKEGKEVKAALATPVIINSLSNAAKSYILACYIANGTKSVAVIDFEFRHYSKTRNFMHTALFLREMGAWKSKQVRIRLAASLVGAVPSASILAAHFKGREKFYLFSPVPEYWSLADILRLLRLPLGQSDLKWVVQFICSGRMPIEDKSALEMIEMAAVIRYSGIPGLVARVLCNYPGLAGNLIQWKTRYSPYVYPGFRGLVSPEKFLKDLPYVAEKGLLLDNELLDRVRQQAKDMLGHHVETWSHMGELQKVAPNLAKELCDHQVLIDTGRGKPNNRTVVLTFPMSERAVWRSISACKALNPEKLVIAGLGELNPKDRVDDLAAHLMELRKTETLDSAKLPLAKGVVILMDKDKPFVIVNRKAKVAKWLVTNQENVSPSSYPCVIGVTKQAQDIVENWTK